MDIPVDQIADDQLAQEIQAVIRTAVSDQDVTVCGLVESYDHEGEAHLLIDLRYAPSDVPIRSENNARMLYEVRRLLAGRGDSRFPYIYHNLPEGQPVASAC